MNSLIPTSRAKTAYGLLSEVSRLILAEPKRYDQGAWLQTIDRAMSIGQDTSHFPACGTIGCVAGWVSTLKVDVFVPTRYYPAIAATAPSIRAQHLLGLDEGQASELFSGGAILQVLRRGQVEPREGTRAYARLGVKHIRKFQQKYKSQLLATKV